MYLKTSKSSPNIRCFVHFNFEIWFAPQRRAFFRHHNFQKWFEHKVFLLFFTCKCSSRHNGVHFFNITTSKSGPNVKCFYFIFSLANVLRATTAYIFSTSQVPEVVRTWCVLFILTSNYASRHNGVHFFDISISKSGPRMACFVHLNFEMCFPPQ